MAPGAVRSVGLVAVVAHEIMLTARRLGACSVRWPGPGSVREPDVMILAGVC